MENNDKIDYFYGVIQNKIDNFIQSELFSCGYWSDEEEVVDLEWLENNFEVKTIVEYVGG